MIALVLKPGGHLYYSIIKITQIITTRDTRKIEGSASHLHTNFSNRRITRSGMGDIFENAFIQENDEYHLDGIVDINKIKKETEFDIKEGDNFKRDLWKNIKNSVIRKNIIKLGIMTGEIIIPIEKTTGEFSILMINKDQINARVKNIKEEERTKIAYIHIAKIQSVIKSTLLEGINAPIALEIHDDRLIHESDSLIAKGEGNLGAGSIKFGINLGIAMHLRDVESGPTLLFKYELLRKNIIKKGKHPFSLTYKMNYALTNSHHSLSTKRIHIDDIFKKLLHLEAPIRMISNNKGKELLIKNSSLREIRGESSKYLNKKGIKENNDIVESKN